MALDVLTDVTAEYLLNVGRTIKFLTDKFAGTMTAEVSIYFLCVVECHADILLPGNHPAYIVRERVVQGSRSRALYI